ncbi:MAG: SDR family NAD(P)-dependent oxidoreductase [Sphingobacteriaceae bacterium]|nr:SDR family NAD(P)-dependent oxidoreductase [Sphingobacteriaceae bacterium]
MNRAPVAFISGASRGIGAAIALLLAQKGYRLALLARNEADLRSVAAQTRLAATDCLCLVADLQRPADIETAVSRCLAHFGRVDVLINNAGIGHFGPIEKLSLEQFQAQLQVNVVASWLLSKLLLPQMHQRDHGLLINILSDAARRPFAGGSTYCASKFAQDGMFRSLQEELKNSSVKVSNIYPGLVNTYFNNKTPSAPQPNKLEAAEVAVAVWDIIARNGEPSELHISRSH